MSKIETPVMTSLQTTVEKMMKDLNVMELLWLL